MTITIGQQDTTPSVWDNLYYSETRESLRNKYSFESDINLSQPSTPVGAQFQTFASNQGMARDWMKLASD